MTLGDDNVTTETDHTPGSNGATPPPPPAPEATRKPTGGAAQRVSEAAKEVIIAYADRPSREIQSALRSEGIEMDIHAIQRARWYHVNGGKEREKEVFQARKAGADPGPPPSEKKKHKGRVPVIPMGAFNEINADPHASIDDMDARLRKRGYILEREELRKQLNRARNRHKVNVPSKGTLGWGVCELAIKGIDDAGQMIRELKLMGLRGVNRQSVYAAKSTHRAYIKQQIELRQARKKARAGETSHPITRTYEVPATPPSPGAAPPPVIIDSRDSDRNKLRVLILQVGINVAREEMAQLEHILAQTQAKL